MEGPNITSLVTRRQNILHCALAMQFVRATSTLFGQFSNYAPAALIAGFGTGIWASSKPKHFLFQLFIALMCHESL